MSTVNRNRKDMDVPSFAYTDRHDGRVFIYSLDDTGLNASFQNIYSN